MSDPALAVEPTSRSVAILGADALLVALPSTPTQLANACFAGGYAEVVPATWGDELIAAGCLEQLESRTGPAIFCACPLVAEQLRGAAELRRFIVPLVSPPVAVARYLRSLYPNDGMKITYIGDCPGADDDAIDERLSPHELLASLAKRGIMPATQRPDLGTHAAHDRRRFYSIPGGVPSPQWLGAQWPKRTLVDVHAGDALAGLANQTLSRSNTLIDFAPHLGCACAGAVGGTDAQDARKAVVALEPPRAQSEIVNADVRVEVSLAIAGERPHAEVSWNDFLAALPAALAMHPERQSSSTNSRTAPRRALQRKAALPRAYMATRRGARRERGTTIRTGTTQPLAHVKRAQDASAADVSALALSTARSDAHTTRREEITGARPNAWVTRRSSHEGMTGPRGVGLQRSGLATADRWLLAGLMLTSSVLVAVLTSALTVRGISRGAPPTMAARAETVFTVAAAPAAAAHDSSSAAHSSRASDTMLVAATSHAADTAPQHEDGGTVVPAPSSAPKLSPMPSQHADVAKRAPSTPRRAVIVAEHVRSRPAPGISGGRASRNPVFAPQTPAPVTTTLPSPTQTQASAPLNVSQPAAPSPSAVPPATLPPPSTSAASAPAAGTTAASAPANNNAQFLEELRAIHAEIDARKRHMDSLTKALDSLNRITKPE